MGFSYKHFLPILGTGLVTSDGELWQRQRLLLSGHLRVEILEDIVGIAQRAADRFLAKFERYEGTGEPVNLAEELRHLTLQVIGEASLSLSADESDSTFPYLYLPIMEEANRRVFEPWRAFLPTRAWFQHRERIKALNAYITGLLRERWAERGGGGGGPPRDMVDRIMDSLVKRKERWTRAVEKQLCYEVKTFVLAGHETSAAMLAWSVYELQRRPDALARVREEADQAMPEPRVVPEKAAVMEMDFTLGALKEALRLYSVVPVVTRVSGQDEVLGGTTVPRGTVVGVLIQGVHNDPANWEEPELYRPERFTEGRRPKPFTFLPFIDGPRNCLGQHLALIEGRVVLGRLLQRFDFRPVDERQGQKHPSVVPIAPLNNMVVTVHPRQPVAGARRTRRAA